MKLIEAPAKVSIFRWNTNKGEIWIELTATDEGLELYCDGQEMASLIVSNDDDAINAIIIKPKLIDW